MDTDRRNRLFAFYKILLVNGLVLGGLIVIIAPFHEVGHAFVCHIYGYKFTMFFDGRNLNTPCSHATNPLWLLTSMGGTFGVIGSLSPLIIKRIRNNEKIVIGFLTSGFSQAIIGLSETFLNSWYLTDNAKNLLSILTMIFFMVLLLKKIIKKKTTSKTT